MINKFANFIQAGVYYLTSYCLVASGKIFVGFIFSGNKQFGVKQLPIDTSADLIDTGGLEIDKDSAGDVLVRIFLHEKSAESLTVFSLFFDRTIRLNSMFDAKELPTGITELYAGLSKMNGNNFSHVKN